MIWLSIFFARPAPLGRFGRLTGSLAMARFGDMIVFRGRGSGRRGDLREGESLACRYTTPRPLLLGLIRINS